MSPWRWTRRLGAGLALTLVLGALAPGCDKNPKEDPEPKAEKDDPKEQWRKQSLALKVSGFKLTGGEAAPAEWFGSGVFVAPGVIATNAHVAARALKVEGRDDTNRPHVFDRILAIDMANDLALLRADYVNNDVVPAGLVSRPNDPKSLRQKEILAIGNSGGLGLSTYNGRITNVIEEGPLGRILHDGQIAGGSSGGPLFLTESMKVVGINHATNAQLNTSLAIPAWTVGDWVGRRGKAQGTPLPKAFGVSGETGVMNEISRDICLPPGKAINVPARYSNGIDFAVIVAPKSSATPVIYGMGAATQQGVKYFDKGVLTGQVLRVFTTPVAAQYVLTLGAPPAASGPTCLKFVIGQINWGQQINDK